MLDALLGTSGTIVSVGELASGLGRMTSGGTCSCSLAIDDCPFWERVRRLVDDIRVLQQAITDASGQPHLLDSSKEITLAITLLRFRPSTRVIHLVRNPVAVVGSHYWRFRHWGGYFKFLRHVYRAPFLSLPFMTIAALGWLVGNGLCEVMHRIDRRRVYRLRYEDLCDRPTAALSDLGDWLGLDLSDLGGRIDRNSALEIGHTIGGNHIRHASSITFDANRAARRVPTWVSLLTGAICFPLMWLYGYPLRPAAVATSHEAETVSVPAPPPAR